MNGNWDTIYSGSNGVWSVEYGSEPIPPASAVARQPTTIGGIGEYSIELPRLPKKKVIDFRRNMENRDRADVADIVAILRAAGLL